MKKQFSTKHKKRKIRPIFSFLIFILGVLISFNILDRTPIELTDKQIVTILLTKSKFVESTENPLKGIKKTLSKLYSNPEKLLSTTTSKLIKQESIIPVDKTDQEKGLNAPLIYIYNSHQTEEYAPSTFLEYNVNPTVMMVDYILEEVFNDKDYKTLVEESSVKEILNQNNWKYSYSYHASRTLLEQRKKEYPTLKYFIDVHRDSLPKEKTTIEINGKSYAKTIFLIGLENQKYEENLKFTTELNDLLNERYPGLSKGIYKKGGAGVNGIYNQDFSPYVILLEIGGYQNTTTEVMNSTLAFAECFMEVISIYESKTTS